MTRPNLPLTGFFSVLIPFFYLSGWIGSGIHSGSCVRVESPVLPGAPLITSSLLLSLAGLCPSIKIQPKRMCESEATQLDDHNAIIPPSSGYHENELYARSQ